MLEGVRTTAKLGAPFIIGVTVGSMLVTHDANPVDAVRKLTWSVSDNLLDISLCPQAPSSAEESQVLSALSAGIEESHHTNEQQSPELTSLLSALPTAENPEQATSLIDTYTRASFGFPVELSITDPSETARINMAGYVERLGVFARILTAVPASLYSAVGVHRVIITNLVQQTLVGDTAALGVTNTLTGAVSLDINHISDPKTVLHELTHLMQTTECSYMIGNDPAFAALNPAGFTYGSANAQSKNLDTTSFATPYAETAETEDVPETSAALWTNTQEIDSQIRLGTVIGRKALLVAARFEDLSPGAVEALARQSAILKQLGEAGIHMARAYID